MHKISQLCQQLLFWETHNCFDYFHKKSNQYKNRGRVYYHFKLTHQEKHEKLASNLTYWQKPFKFKPIRRAHDRNLDPRLMKYQVGVLGFWGTNYCSR
jgi:hypothetical protein